MARSLDGKVALVTGGASGMGRATSLLFAREGAKVVVADVDVEGGKETVRLVEKKGGEAMFVKTDVSAAKDVEAMVTTCVRTYKRLDCAFNNAGIVAGMNTTHECTEENFDRLIRINLKGVWLCMKFEIPQMLKQGGGAIVNMGSVAAMRGAASLGLPVYGATKAGVVQLTRTAALENARTGIRINAVCPGLIATPMAERQSAAYPEAMAGVEATLPLGRMGKPEEVAEAVVWLCSDAASFVLGHAMSVDGGVVA